MFSDIIVPAVIFQKALKYYIDIFLYFNRFSFESICINFTL